MRRVHFKCHLYTRAFPSDNEIETALYRFDEDHISDDDQQPVFHYDWYQVGGRYGGKLKLNMKTQDGVDKYETGYLVRYRRAGRLFRCNLLEKTTRGILDHESWKERKADESEALNYCGMRDEILYVDGAWIPDLVNADEIADQCFCVVGPDGEALARRTRDAFSMNMDDETYEKQSKAFDEKVREMHKQWETDCYLTVIDMHT